MASNPQIDLVALLPAGEWADIKILNQAPGMMADRDWAILAKARWLRAGGKPAFIKFVVPAGAQAGDTTVMVTGAARLRELQERLQRLRAVDDIPLVPLLSVQLSDEGLLIAMAEVTPLQDLIEQGVAYPLSRAVLRDLDPEKPGSTRWLHFDICPRNIGVTPDGRCVLIDVDSMYLEDEGRYDISVPAWKPFRAPKNLVREVTDRLASGGVTRDLAIRKTTFEVILAAAECVLGPLSPGRGNFDRSLVESWASAADERDAAAAFWRAELLAMADAGRPRRVREVLADLEEALASSPAEPHAPLAHAIPRETQLEAPTPGPAALPEIAAPPGWSTDWLLLKPAAHALRAGRLDRPRIREYRAALTRLCEQYPQQREPWEELLLVTVSYEKDPRAALEVITAALRNIPDDADLKKMRDVIQNWVAER